VRHKADKETLDCSEKRVSPRTVGLWTNRQNEGKMFHMTHQTLSTNQVASIAGVSLRQLQWWDEKRVVQPHHHGHRRIYSNQEAVDIAVIAELRKRGLSLQAIRRPLRQMQRQCWKHMDFDRLMNFSDELWLVVDPTPGSTQRAACVVTNGEAMLEVFRKCDHAMHVIDLADILRRVQQPQRREPTHTINRYQ